MKPVEVRNARTRLFSAEGLRRRLAFELEYHSLVLESNATLTDRYYVGNTCDKTGSSAAYRESSSSHCEQVQQTVRETRIRLLKLLYLLQDSTERCPHHQVCFSYLELTKY